MTSTTKALILQPDDSRQRITDALSQSSIEFIQHSFIDIEPIAVEPKTYADYHGVIWISKNAVKFANHSGLSFSPNTPMFAVGPSTARLAANTFGASTCCPTFKHDSESLLSLAELKTVDKQQWLIVKGEKGRDLIFDTLRARGAKVDSIDVYRRVKRSFSDEQQVTQWMNTVNLIVVTSAEQLGYFLSSLPREAGSWLSRCHWIVPSERLRDLIPFVAANTISVTGSATESKMIEAIIEHG